MVTGSPGPKVASRTASSAARPCAIVASPLTTGEGSGAGAPLLDRLRQERDGHTGRRGPPRVHSEVEDRSQPRVDVVTEAATQLGLHRSVHRLLGAVRARVLHAPVAHEVVVPVVPAVLAIPAREDRAVVVVLDLQ